MATKSFLHSLLYLRTKKRDISPLISLLVFNSLETCAQAPVQSNLLEQIYTHCGIDAYGTTTYDTRSWRSWQTTQYENLGIPLLHFHTTSRWNGSGRPTHVQHHSYFQTRRSMRFNFSVIVVLLLCSLGVVVSGLDWATANTSVWLSSAAYCETNTYQSRTYIGYSKGFMARYVIEDKPNDVQV